ncbi:hypothetical protein EB796_001281 [Bugula neritina]|uniref:Uncharacterized protein n=1 Tax=Bugula neritina TaxID=10212 RepID=A0A7J7KQG0_BUGNE|nr:hypothetical protein EB796_001281 [Bugula neritina]
MAGSLTTIWKHVKTLLQPRVHQPPPNLRRPHLHRMLMTSVMSTCQKKSYVTRQKEVYKSSVQDTLFYIFSREFCLFCIVLVLIYYLPSCTIPRCVSIINSCIRSCFHCCLYAKSRRSTNNRTPPSSKTASSYRASYNHGAVRILREAEEDDNADSDCEMLPNKSADFSKTPYSNADLQSLDSKA